MHLVDKYGWPYMYPKSKGVHRVARAVVLLLGGRLFFKRGKYGDKRPTEEEKARRMRLFEESVQKCKIAAQEDTAGRCPACGSRGITSTPFNDASYSSSKVYQQCRTCKRCFRKDTLEPAYLLRDRGWVEGTQNKGFLSDRTEAVWNHAVFHHSEGGDTARFEIDYKPRPTQVLKEPPHESAHRD